MRDYGLLLDETHFAAVVCKCRKDHFSSDSRLRTVQRSIHSLMDDISDGTQRLFGDFSLAKFAAFPVFEPYVLLRFARQKVTEIEPMQPQLVESDLLRIPASEFHSSCVFDPLKSCALCADCWLPESPVVEPPTFAYALRHTPVSEIH